MFAYQIYFLIVCCNNTCYVMRKIKEKLFEKAVSRKLKDGEKLISEQPGMGGESNGETGTDGQFTSDDESKTSKDSKSSFFKRFSRRRRDSSASSKDSKDTKKTDKSSSDEDEIDDGNEYSGSGLKAAKKDAQFGATQFKDTDKKGTWHVLVRVIDGRDLCAGSLRVRVSMEGTEKATRLTCDRHWRQNLMFTEKGVTLEKMAAKILNIKLTRAGRIMEHIEAAFSTPVSAIVHSSDRCVNSKWIALRTPTTEDDDFEGETRGFLKVTFCVFHSSEAPPSLQDDIESDEVWSAGQMEEHTLRIRLFHIQQLADELINIVELNSRKKKKKHISFFVRGTVGNASMETVAMETSDHTIKGTTTDAVSLEQELYLPIQWPTVLSKIKFELFMKQGRRQRCLGQASIPLRNIYQPGEGGHLPTFGPAFINFYGHEVLLKLKWRKEKETIAEGVGSKYLGRILCGVDLVDWMGESSQRSALDHASIEQAKQWETLNRYSLYCSFFACNMINPLYASENISFHLSMGIYGSANRNSDNCRASTFGSMPDTDKHKYFFMPWGNHKPLSDVQCLWEDIDARLHRYNAIMKITEMLREIESSIPRVGSTGEAASLFLESLDHMDEMMGRVENHHDPKIRMTELDRMWEEVRKTTIKKIVSDLEIERWQLSESLDICTEKILRLINRIKDSVKQIADDCQISLPWIIVKMSAGDHVVGYAKINPAEVFFSHNDALSGEFCGRMRAVPLQWPSLVDRKRRMEQFPAVLHTRMWFGRRGDVSSWNDILKPAELKSYLEVFTHQRKSKLNREWKQWNGPMFSNELGTRDMDDAVKRETFGWNHTGNWICRTSHDMWISNDSGRQQTVDRAYEVEKKSKDGKWKFQKYTDYFGGELDKSLKEAPEGWEYKEKWQIDTHLNNGDKQGWIYAIKDSFGLDTDIVEKEERPVHLFRRRCLARTRRSLKYSKDLENFEPFEKELGDIKWEFARSFDRDCWHIDDIQDASVRRRRFLVEVERKKADEITNDREAECFYLPRLFEVHDVVSTWQLRCYILWAKDLLPIVKTSSNAFVRITFLTRSGQTLLVGNSQNPIWCETLLFDQIPIPGSKQQININPPTIIIEVRGERSDDSEMFLGRFEATPNVVCDLSDAHSKPKWHALQFRNGKTRGAVLAAFDLFHTDPKNIDMLPLVPMRKKQDNAHMEVPAELRPKFSKYSVQFLCWGVRNISRYHLLPVRRPFVEILISDLDTESETLENAATNPNFPTPLITIIEVSMPTEVEMSPPIVLNLHDTRAFRRKPVVGVCHINDITKYIRQPPKKKAIETAKNWEAFNDLVTDEEKAFAAVKILNVLPQLSHKPRVDWWSKYYASCGFHQKAPGFIESGLELLTVFKCELEDASNYRQFTDFLDTFSFNRPAKGNFDDPEEKEKVGELKGKLFITRIGKEPHELVEPPGVEFCGPVKCLLRVYVVEARNLQSLRSNGLCDPYIIAKCGKQKVNLKKRYRADTTDPQFGECIEMEVTIPLEKDLILTVMDRRRLLPDEEIGSTTIDIENRLLTKWRATLGLAKQYTVHGEYGWRDQAMPLITLKRYCMKMLLPPPKILKKKDDIGLEVLNVEFWYSDVKRSMIKDDEDFIRKSYRAAAGADEEFKEMKESVKEKDADGAGDGPDKESYSQKDNEEPKEDVSFRHKMMPKDMAVDAPIDDLLEARRYRRDMLAGRPIQAVALYILNMMNLVPEHVENRMLRTGIKGAQVTGELRMFVDILPIPIGPCPPALNIAPRKPDQYQLRIAVFTVSSAIPIKRSFGDPTSDLYVKVFVNGVQKVTKTDVHYRSMDGCGEFNWRFVTDVDYDPWEKKIVSYQKTRLFRRAREQLVEPLIILQLWDKNRFKKDQMLGEMTFNMLNFKEGITDPQDIKRYSYKPKRKNCCYRHCRKCCMVRCCRACIKTRCCTRREKTKVKPFPRPPRYQAPGDEIDSVSLFDAQTLRAWWPVLRDKHPHYDEDHKKKDDDFDESAQWVMGLVEMEMSIVPLREAKADPVGKARKEPNHDPYLPKPTRSKWNAFWLLSRVRPALRFCWSKCGMQLLFWILVILLIFVAVYALVYNWPLILIHIFK